MLDVTDGHRIHWEVHGHGKPAVVFHGGPGSGCPPWWLDLTEHLIADIEALRTHLGIDRWLVLGASWGTTLALTYAQRFRERVSEMVLFSVTTTTRREVEWITRGVGRYFPAEWERFRDAVGAERLVEAYNDALLDPDPAVHRARSRGSGARGAGHARSRPADDPRLRRHPAALVHGRVDLSSPLDIPWALSRAWPSSELVVIDDVGHKGGPSMTAAIVAALERFR